MNNMKRSINNTSYPEPAMVAKKLDFAIKKCVISKVFWAYAAITNNELK